MHSAKSTHVASVGDLGVSPRAVRVDEHEDVRRAVADVLVVEARGPSRASAARARAPRRSAAAGFHRSRRRGGVVRRLGVEVEDVFHARDELRVDRRGCTTSSSARVSARFPRVGDGWSRPTAIVVRRSAAPSRRRADPASSAPARSGAPSTPSRRGAPPRPRELARRAGPGRFAERAGQALFDEALLRSGTRSTCRRRRSARSRSSVDCASAASRICARLSRRTALRRRWSALQVVAFVGRQRDAVAYVHGHLGSHRRSHVQSCVAAIHRDAGPVPGLHPHLHAGHREPPAEADIQRFFGSRRRPSTT